MLPRIQRLLAEDADVNARGKYGYTPLVHASYSGHADAVRLLLDAGAIPSMTTDDGGTALYWAASQGHDEVLRLLLDCGAEVDAMRDSEWTPLTAAIYNGHESVAELLLEAGARRSRVARKEYVPVGGQTRARANREVSATARMARFRSGLNKH